MDDLLKYFLTFATALVIAWALTRVMITLGPRLGMIDMPDQERRIHTRPIPRAGGIAVFIAFNITVFCLYRFFWPQFSGALDFHWWLGFLAGSAVLLCVGLVDDTRGLSAIVKLLGQIFAASVLFYLSKNGGFRLLWGLEIPVAIDWLLTVIWFVAIINAFNLIDGLDGLCSGLAIVSATGLAASALLRDNPGDALIMLALIGAAAGFLRYNFHPARIFLGDTGSMFFGFALAAISLKSGGKSTFFLSVAIPFMAAGIPIMDTLLAIWRRSMRRVIASRSANTTDSGPKIMGADKDHLHHRLLAMGLSQRRVALILYSVNSLLVLIGLFWVFQQKVSIGLFLILFFAGIYVLVRHLIHIEIWDTGRMLVQGLKRPNRSLLALFAYPLWDLVWLSLSLVLAFGLNGSSFSHMQLIDWIKLLPLWVTPVFLTLVITKAYSRLWIYGSFRDFLILSIAMSLGVLAALAINLILNPGTGIRLQLLRISLLWFLIGWIGVFCVRAVMQILREWMLTGANEKKLGGHYATTRLLLYGAGDLGSLFLRQMRVINPELVATRQVVGFIDDNENLHNRYLQGVRVLGALQDLERLIDTHNIDEVVVTTQLYVENEAQLQAIIRNKGIFLSYWKLSLTGWTPYPVKPPLTTQPQPQGTAKNNPRPQP